MPDAASQAKTDQKSEKPPEKKSPPPIKKIQADVTLGKANLARAAAEGTRSKGVEYLQEALTVNGHYRGDLDGVAGPKTRAALQKFAQTYGVTGDPLDAVPLLGFNLV